MRWPASLRNWNKIAICTNLGICVNVPRLSTTLTRTSRMGRIGNPSEQHFITARWPFTLGWSVNLKLYQAIRRQIRLGAGLGSLREWMPDWRDGNDAANFVNCTGYDYDYLDELVIGVLQFEEPSAEVVGLESEMVPYQPTPARHIFDLIRRTALTERDSLIDIGSGLGHVTLIASICTRASCTGIELEPSYVDCAWKSARSLNLNNVKFIESEVRTADLSGGTVFYLYTPFSGSILRDVLKLLRNEAVGREIRICTFGPCAQAIAEERWLSAIGPLQTDRIAIFHSRD
jgi:Histone methylation protein DOT1